MEVQRVLGRRLRVLVELRLLAEWWGLQRKWAGLAEQRGECVAEDVRVPAVELRLLRVELRLLLLLEEVLLMLPREWLLVLVLVMLMLMLMLLEVQLPVVTMVGVLGMAGAIGIAEIPLVHQDLVLIARHVHAGYKSGL